MEVIGTCIKAKERRHSELGREVGRKDDCICLTERRRGKESEKKTKEYENNA